MSGEKTDPPDIGETVKAAEEVTSNNGSPVNDTEAQMAEVSESEVENMITEDSGTDSRAVVPSKALDPVAATSWAQQVQRETTGCTAIIDVLDIVLKKTEKSASFYLHHKEKANLVFFKLGIPRDKVVGIDQEDFRTIRVHLNCAADQYKVAHSIQVRDGLVTLPMRMFKRLTKVKIDRVGVGTDPDEVKSMLSHFGHTEGTPTECTYYQDADLSKLTMEEKMMRGVRNGNMEATMYITKHIPSYALLPSGRKVRVRYSAQPVTCARCHQGIRGCKGGANAAKCEKAGGKAVPLSDFWEIITAREEISTGVTTLEETVIPGNVLLVEGFSKEAGKEWVGLFLGQCIQTYIEPENFVRSEDKLSWRVYGLSPADIRKALEAVSGTQYKGRTVYLTPVVTDKDKPPSEPETPDDSEGVTPDDSNDDNGDPSGGQPSDQPPLPPGTPGAGEKGTSPPPPPPGSGGEETFEPSSQEKKKRRQEKRRQEKKEREEEAERARNLDLLKNVKPRTNHVSTRSKKKEKDDKKRGLDDVEKSPSDQRQAAKRVTNSQTKH